MPNMNFILGPIVCADQSHICREFLAASPMACTTYPDLRRFQCARSCGFCRTEDDSMWSHLHFSESGNILLLFSVIEIIFGAKNYTIKKVSTNY